MRKVFASLVHLISTVGHLEKGATPAANSDATLSNLGEAGKAILDSKEGQAAIFELETYIEAAAEKKLKALLAKK